MHDGLAAQLERLLWGVVHGCARDLDDGAKIVFYFGFCKGGQWSVVSYFSAFP